MNGIMKNEMTSVEDRVRVHIPAHPKFLSVVRSVSDQMGTLSGMTKSEKYEITLAVDEACSNAIKHACKRDSRHKVDVSFKFTDQAFEVILEDDGEKVDPKKIQGRKLEDVRPGGLGVHFIKRAFDVVAFEERKEPGNRLQLVRYRGREQERG